MCKTKFYDLSCEDWFRSYFSQQLDAIVQIQENYSYSEFSHDHDGTFGFEIAHMDLPLHLNLHISLFTVFFYRACVLVFNNW